MTDQSSFPTLDSNLPVTLSYRESGVAVITLGKPGETAVTFTAERLTAFHQAIQLIQKTNLPGLIITGPSKDMFSVGADVRVIEKVTDPKVGEDLARQGQMIFNTIASLPFPTIAAISGPCVGGACELSLACSFRIATEEKSTLIGLPEVKLGILPGFGGTQRLPRTIGIRKALDIILGGKTLRPKQALRAGLISHIVSYDQLLTEADRLVRSSGHIPNKPTISLVDRILACTSIGRSFVRRSTEQLIRRQTKGFYPAPPAALESVLHGLAHGMDAGLALEAKELGRLIITPESKALVKIFFLTESAKSIGKSGSSALPSLHSLVIGAGAMGAGIAGLLAQKEIPVILKDTDDKALSKGMGHIKASLDRMNYLSEAERTGILNRIQGTTQDSPSIANCHFAIEAIVENLPVKQKVLQAYAVTLPAHAVIATNTSSLSVTDIAEPIPHPERVIGMHFFNPVEKMPLVEIIRGKATNDRTVSLVAALTVRLGKFPVVVEDVPGFLVNRILTPYLNVACTLLQQGYSIRQIDRAATQFGMPMGPLRLLDEVGLDIAAHVAEVMEKGYGERMHAPTFAKKLVGAGRLGKKTKAGFYDFRENEQVPFAGIQQILELPTSGNKDESLLQDALIFSLINEAVRCLDEGVAGAPGKEAAYQIDLATVMGMGFPPFRGGVLHYAESFGAKRVLARMKELKKLVGTSSLEAWRGIEQRATDGKSFFEKQQD